MNISVPFDNAQAVTDWAINWLRMQGLEVKPRNERAPETPLQISRRLRLDECDSRYISRRMARGDYPHVDIRRGPTGRICTIKTTPEFDAWLLDKKP